MSTFHFPPHWPLCLSKAGNLCRNEYPIWFNSMPYSLGPRGGAAPHSFYGGAETRRAALCSEVGQQSKIWEKVQELLRTLKGQSSPACCKDEGHVTAQRKWHMGGRARVRGSTGAGKFSQNQDKLWLWETRDKEQDGHLIK